MHPEPTPAMITDLEAALRRVKLVVRTIAKVTQVFPSLPRDRLQRPPRRVEGASFQSGSGHAWSFSNGFWRCTTCMKLTLKKQITPALATQPCGGVKQSVQVEAMTAKGHTIARTVAEVPILFCLKCGAFTARRAYGLAAACKGKPTAPGAQALARIRRGVQPWQSAGSRTRASTHMFTEAWSEAAGGYNIQGPAVRSAKRHLAAARLAQPPAAEMDDAHANPPPPLPPRRRSHTLLRRHGVLLATTVRRPSGRESAITTPFKSRPRRWSWRSHA